MLFICIHIEFCCAALNMYCRTSGSFHFIYFLVLFFSIFFLRQICCFVQILLFPNNGQFQSDFFLFICWFWHIYISMWNIYDNNIEFVGAFFKVFFHNRKKNCKSGSRSNRNVWWSTCIRFGIATSFAFSTSFERRMNCIQHIHSLIDHHFFFSIHRELQFNLWFPIFFVHLTHQNRLFAANQFR